MVPLLTITKRLAELAHRSMWRQAQRVQFTHARRDITGAPSAACSQRRV